MSPALIAIIAQAIVQYGLPAVLQIIANFKKDNPTEADWIAVFSIAQTPYGLEAGNQAPPTPVKPSA